jgi:hypothetical protein
MPLPASGQPNTKISWIMGKSQCRPAVQLPTGMMHLLPARCPIEAKYKYQQSSTARRRNSDADMWHHAWLQSYSAASSPHAATAGCWPARYVRSAISKRQSSGRSRRGRRPWSGWPSSTWVAVAVHDRSMQAAASSVAFACVQLELGDKNYRIVARSSHRDWHAGRRRQWPAGSRSRGEDDVVRQKSAAPSLARGLVWSDGFCWVDGHLEQRRHACNCLKGGGTRQMLASGVVFQDGRTRRTTMIVGLIDGFDADRG